MSVQLSCPSCNTSFALPALPERYVVRPQSTPLPRMAWWEQILQFLPGFN